MGILIKHALLMIMNSQRYSSEEAMTPFGKRSTTFRLWSRQQSVLANELSSTSLPQLTIRVKKMKSTTTLELSRKISTCL